MQSPEFWEEGWGRVIDLHAPFGGNRRKLRIARQRHARALRAYKRKFKS